MAESFLAIQLDVPSALAILGKLVPSKAGLRTHVSFQGFRTLVHPRRLCTVFQKHMRPALQAQTHTLAMIKHQANCMDTAGRCQGHNILAYLPLQGSQTQYIRCTPEQWGCCPLIKQPQPLRLQRLPASLHSRQMSGPTWLHKQPLQQRVWRHTATLKRVPQGDLRDCRRACSCQRQLPIHAQLPHPPPFTSALALLGCR